MIKLHFQKRNKQCSVLVILTSQTIDADLSVQNIYHFKVFHSRLHETGLLYAELFLCGSFDVTIIKTLLRRGSTESREHLDEEVRCRWWETRVVVRNGEKSQVTVVLGKCFLGVQKLKLDISVA